MSTTEIQLQEMPSSSSLIAKIVDYKKEWELLLAEVNTIEITSSLDTQPAHDVMKKAQKLLKDAETIRTTIVKPFNDQVKAINSLAKIYTSEIEEAKTIAKQKIVDFELKQEEERQKELLKIQQICTAILNCKNKGELDQKMLKIEENWYIGHADVIIAINTMIQKFEDQIRIAKEKEEAEKEEKRLAELKKSNDQEAIALAEEQARLDKIKKDQDDQKRKQEQEELQEQLLKKKQEEEQMLLLDKQLNKTKWVRETVKFEVTDETLVPRMYCTSNDKLIRDAVAKWIRDIPWVNIFTSLSVQ